MDTEAPIVIDEEKALDLLKQAAATAPDFVYRESYEFCEYVVKEDQRRNGVPYQCIVGQVFTLLGVPEERQGADGFNGSASDACGWLRRDGLDFTSSAVELLTEAQKWQDGYTVTWTEAVRLAVELPQFDSHRDSWEAANALLGREILDPHGDTVAQSYGLDGAA